MDLKRRKEHKRGPRKLLRRCDVQGGLGCSWLWSKTKSGRYFARVLGEDYAERFYIAVSKCSLQLGCR
jgi:hypothetical protein